MENNNPARQHFCNCPMTKCPRHPSVHGKGCDPCVADNLKKGKMPACFFLAVSDDVSGVRDFTIEGFVNFFGEHREEYRKKLGK